MASEAAGSQIIISIFRLYLLLLLALVLGLFVDFSRRTAASINTATMPATAVVFTGQFNRLQYGVDLLKADAIQTLLVSGFNAGAGLQLNTLGTQFSIAPGVLNGWLKNGRLLLGTQANSTLENAVEVKHMLAAGNLDRLVLITGECHMPRASLLLEGELRDVSIQRLPVAGGCETPELVANEFLKYLYSFAYRMGGIFI